MTFGHYGHTPTLVPQTKIGKDWHIASLTGMLILCTSWDFQIFIKIFFCNYLDCGFFSPEVGWVTEEKNPPPLIEGALLLERPQSLISFQSVLRLTAPIRGSSLITICLCVFINVLPQKCAFHFVFATSKEGWGMFKLGQKMHTI